MSKRASKDDYASFEGKNKRQKKATFTAQKELRDDVDDVDDSDLLEQRKQRRGKVNLDGYKDEENSSEDDEKYTAKKRKTTTAKPAAATHSNALDDDDDDDDDMFAENKKPSTSKQTTAVEDSKEVKFFTEGDIVGQDYASRGEYGEDGEQLVEAFHMQEELEGGKFDTIGNYVPKPEDPNRFHDKWLDGMNRLDFEKAKEAQDKAEVTALRKERKLAEDPVSGLAREEVWGKLLDVMKPRESIPAALRRAGGGNNNNNNKPRNRFKKSKKPISPEEEAEQAARREAVEYLTSLADRLMALGDLTVYDETYESLSYKLNGPINAVADATSEAATAASEPSWEYKWEDKDDAEIFGPYLSSQMEQWNSQGFFTGETAVRLATGAGDNASRKDLQAAPFASITSVSFAS